MKAWSDVLQIIARAQAKRASATASDMAASMSDLCATAKAETIRVTDSEVLAREDAEARSHIMGFNSVRALVSCNICDIFPGAQGAPRQPHVWGLSPEIVPLNGISASPRESFLAPLESLTPESTPAAAMWIGAWALA